MPRSNDASVAHCVLRMDSVPVRCIAADKTSIYLAEAPLRGSSSGGHGGHGGRLTARDPRTGKISRTLSGGGVTLSCIMVANDGHLWSGTFDGLIRVSRRGGQALHETRAHASSVHSLAEAVEAVFSAGGDFVVRAWSPSLTPLRTLRAHTASVHALAAPIPSPGTYGYHGEAFSAGGAGIWSGGDDHAVHVWSGSEASGFEHVATIDDFAAPVRVLVPQNASPPRVWAADAAGALRVYDARSRSVLRTCQSASGAVPPTTCVACTPRAVWVGDASGGITIYDGTSLARLQFLAAVHSGVVHGLACPKVTLGPGPPDSSEADSPVSAGGIVVWSFGADCAVRGWGMSERLQDRLKHTREAIEGQHTALSMMRSMLPRAAAAAAGRLEAAAQRSEVLTRRLLDLEVTMSVNGEVGDSGLHQTGGVGMPPPSPGRYNPSYPVSALNDPSHYNPVTSGASSYGRGAEASSGSAAYDAAAQRRSAEYNSSVEHLAVAQREVSYEVEQALLALRGRIDELLHFTQATHGHSSTEAVSAAAVTTSAPMSTTATPRRHAPPLPPRTDPLSCNPHMVVPVSSPRHRPPSAPQPLDVSDAAWPPPHPNAPMWAR